MHFFGQFTDHNSGRKHENQTNDSIFFHLLFPLELIVTFIFVFEISQNSFSCGPPCGSFWSVKYLNFWKNLPIRTTHHTFLEVDTLRLLKSILRFDPRREPKKGISIWTRVRSVTAISSKIIRYGYRNKNSYQRFRVRTPILPETLQKKHCL